MSIDINQVFTNLIRKTSDSAISAVVEQMKNSQSLEEKCILAREYINPQSIIMEQIIYLIAPGYINPKLKTLKKHMNVLDQPISI